MKNNSSHLNREQQLAASFINGPMLVVAGPGSGKTFLLIERIINLINAGIPPEKILVITFSKKAALEMENRFQRRMENGYLPVNFGTFHAVFFHILKTHGLYDQSSILTLKEKQTICEEAGRLLRIPKAGTLSWQNDMIEKISCYKNTGNAIFEDGSPFIFDEGEKEIFLKVFGKYNKICRENRKLDFDDMVSECLNLFINKPEIAGIWQKKYTHICVDEFQDINNAQYDVLKILEGNDHNIFAVGDDDQSIYGFRGSAPGIMKTFMDDHVNAERVFLKLNYRSSFSVVEAADALIRNNRNRMDRERQQTLKHRKPGRVVINTFVSETEEAEYIVNEIKNLRSDPELKDEKIAIIYRSEHCAMIIEEKIRTAGYDYEKKSKSFDFYELETAGMIISYLRLITGCADESDYLRVMNHPHRALSRDALLYAIKNGNDVIDGMEKYYKDELGLSGDDIQLKNLSKLKNDIGMAQKLPLKAVLIYLLKGVGLEKEINAVYVKNPVYPKSADEIIEEIKERMHPFKTAEGFLKNIDIVRERRDNKNNGRYEEKIKGEKGKAPNIVFISAHASKGLEYSVVFAVGLQEGLFPHRKSLNGPATEEERRLFYVTMTRAKEYLYLCGRGQEHGKRPSRFIDEVKSGCSQSFIASNSSLSRNSSNASATISYSSSSSI